MRSEKFGCKRNWSWLGFGLTMFSGLVAKLMKQWSHGFLAISKGNYHKCVQNDEWRVWLGFGLAKFGGLALFLCLGLVFLPWYQNWWKGEVIVFQQSWWGIVTNACKLRCEKFGCKTNWSWLGFGIAKLGGLTFCALVSKLVKKWSLSFWAILVGDCHKCIQNDVSKLWLQKELILVGVWLSQVWSLGLDFVPL